MLYTREIYEQVMIQYIILFALEKADRIITHDQLTSIVLDNCNIKFTEFRIALDNLEKIGHIRVFSPDSRITYCELLPLGKEANSFFYHKIPVYIREPIEDYIAPFFKEESLKKSIKAELLPLNEKEYMAELGIYDGKTPLMSLAVYAGTREYANSMIYEFKKNPQRVYETIMELIGNGVEENEEKETEETTEENEIG